MSLENGKELTLTIKVNPLDLEPVTELVDITDTCIKLLESVGGNTRQVTPNWVRSKEELLTLFNEWEEKYG